MAFHFKLLTLLTLMLLFGCKQTFEDDFSQAEIKISESTRNSSSKANSLYSEFLNWDSLNFEFAYQEPAAQYSKGLYVFICKSNTIPDTLKIGVNPVAYQVKEGYYLFASVSGMANRYNGANFTFDAQAAAKSFYRQLNDHEGELLINCFVYSAIRTPDPNLFRRWITGRFVIPR